VKNSFFENSTAEEITADVRLEGRDFGPTTRVFGLRFHVERPEFEASFYVGGGGNNSRRLGNFRVNLPPDFSQKTVLQAVLYLVGAAIRAGIEPYQLSYVDDSHRGRYIRAYELNTLRTEDVSVQLFQLPHPHLLRWPGEPNHDEEVAAARHAEWQKRNPVVCLSPEQASVEAQKRAANAARLAEWNKLHAPICSPEELRSREEMKARALPLIRVNDLARELNVKSKMIVDAARHVGIRRGVRYSDCLGADEADKVRSYLRTRAVRRVA
jgi:Translation initiation factor IF-2, N-terminal region